MLFLQVIFERCCRDGGEQMMKLTIDLFQVSTNLVTSYLLFFADITCMHGLWR